MNHYRQEEIRWLAIKKHTEDFSTHWDISKLPELGRFYLASTRNQQYSASFVVQV